MNYTYLPSTPYSTHPTIIMTMNPSSRKTLNLVSNPRVSLLVHDWVSHRPPTAAPDPARSGSPPPAAARSSLASMLLQMNTSALSRISATINGEARILEVGGEEEVWCKERHLENHTFREGEQEVGDSGGGGGQAGMDDGGRNCFIEGEDVRVVVVRVREGRVADWKGGVRDWLLQGEAEGGNHTMVNGVT